MRRTVYVLTRRLGKRDILVGEYDDVGTAEAVMLDMYCDLFQGCPGVEKLSDEEWDDAFEDFKREFTITPKVRRSRRKKEVAPGV